MRYLSKIDLICKYVIVGSNLKMSSKRSSTSSPPPKKRTKSNQPSTSEDVLEADSKKDFESLNFKEQFENARKKTSESIIKFKFNKSRLRILSSIETVSENTKGIVYWMSRDCRVQDNWAFLFAQKLALKNEVPLHVCFCLVPKFLDATIRHYNFLLNGLKEVEEECSALNITFHLLLGNAATNIPKFVKDHKMGAVVCDFSPLRVPLQWVDDVLQKLPETVPLVQVDAHNIVPVWETSDKQEYAARTIRIKIDRKLDTFLTDFPPVIQHPYDSEMKKTKVNWKAAFDSLEVDMTVDEVDWAKPGYSNGVKELQQFCNRRLKMFNDKRNDPLANALSNLSPWFHFGQISVQRAILTTKKFKKRYPESVAAFVEEAVIRRELSDNFCFYNKNYDSLAGLADWARQTLNDHKKDKRDWIYTKSELNASETHDDLWNSAQIQLCQEGKMHGFLRMYWAKKILEWTKSPEEALEIAIYLNDRYSLDGRDPNGYVGCMWSIGGIHDQGWRERSVFGKIRYMNYKGCERKFDVKAFVARYGGKVHSKGKKK
ncbi:Deoxyribodipyrimidine photo-lyase [Pseudolycoriella hygida]|uniref:Deoxyribodipyrimidine photo-lyase n=1 Tax=Pseudolycoriella hygida TaxID=35572 RepID=A0A9Q0N073_9DIPT|nr:Deoxyribodipyrimidine photo-lyase [Pseudolycoriella hygida]